MVRHVQLVIEPVRKEAKEREVSNTDAVDTMWKLIGIIGVVPVDQQAAPDHCEQNWKVDPVHPADRKRVLSLQADSFYRPGSCDGSAEA